MKAKSIYRKLIHFLLPALFVSSFVFNGQSQRVAIRLKKNQFLILRDTIIRSQNDTVVYLPSSVEYKKRKDYENYIRNRYVRQFWDQIYLENPQRFVDYDTTFMIKSQNPYAAFEGKAIRNIFIVKENVFNRDVVDTVFIKTPLWIEKVSESLHEKTKTFVVRNNLFIKNDSVVDQKRLADNERLLRTLPYMHDARIFVKKVPHSKDSVDIEVIVQDLWSIGAYFVPYDVNYFQWRIYDENFLGMGQSLTYRGQYRTPRTKPLASEITYMKNNLGGTFINPYIRYSELNGGVHLGRQDETSITVGAIRPIYMPTARLAGGYFYSNNWSVNNTGQDTSFYSYKYFVNDIWGGVTFSGFKTSGDDYDIISRQNRSRIFLSARYFDTQFIRQPGQEAARTSALYNNTNLTLGQATYFRYDYYKTRYIYGFGRTEDIPYGYSYLINSGVQETLDQLRYYMGAATFNSWVTKKGDFFLLDLRASAYYNTVHHVQDFFVRGEGTYMTKIHQLGRWKSRFYVTFNYAKIINPQFNAGLNINELNGIQQFYSATLLGFQTSSLSFTTNMFPRFRLMGFRFAFILLAQVAQIGTESEFLFNNKLYTGLGAGFRTKNENLVFDELDLRFYFFPNAPDEVSTFKIVTSTTPRLRINLRGVDEPTIIGL